MRRTGPLLAFVLACGPAGADEAAIAALLDRALAENRRLATCLALVPGEADRIGADWARQVAASLALLDAAGLSPPGLEAFAASAAPGALLPAPDTPWAEVVAFCTDDPGWLDRLRQYDAVYLPHDLADLLPR